MGQILFSVQEVSKKFNREAFGNILHRKKVLEARIEGIQWTLQTWDSMSLEQLELKLH